MYTFSSMYCCMLLALLLLAAEAQAQLQPAAAQPLEAAAGATARYAGLLDGLTLTLSPGQVQLSGLKLQGGKLSVAVLPGRVDTAIKVFPARTAALDYTQTFDAATRSSTVTATLPDSVAASDLDGAVVWCDACASSTGPYTGVVAYTDPPQQAFVNRTDVVAFTLTNAGPPPRRRRARALLQQPANCALAVGAAPPETFAACSTVDNPMGVPYQVFTTLTPSPSGGTRWRGALRVEAAAVQGQWAGFGFPATPSTMVGSRAVVVKECAACPSGARVDGYLLKDYVASANVPGSFPIQDASAAKVDSMLVAAFTVDLPQTPQALTSAPFDAIFAIGPLDAAGNNIASHATGEFPYGGTKVQLAGALAQPAGGASLAAADPPPDPPAVPQPEVPPNLLAVAVPAPASPTAEVAGGKGCILAVGGGQEQSFAVCSPLSGLGDRSLKVLCTLSAPAAAGGATPAGNFSLQMGLLAMGVPANSWVAVGFPASPGTMIGATAMVLSSCPSCPTGARLQDYYLGAKSTADVAPPGHLAVTDITAAAGAGGELRGMFKVALPPALVPGGNVPVIYASGPLDDSGRLQQHSVRAAATLNIAAGGGATPTSDSSFNAKLNAHAWLMVVGWTIILGGAVVANSFRYSSGSLWFQAHRAMQLLGMACVLAGFITIFRTLPQKTIYTVHYNLGVSAVTLALAQLTALVARPHLDSRWRRAWGLWHRWVGRSAVVLSIANIYYGMINVRRVGSWAVISYSIVFGLIVGIGIVKDGVDYLQLPPPAAVPKFSCRHEEREALAPAGRDGSGRAWAERGGAQAARRSGASFGKSADSSQADGEAASQA